MGNSKPDPLKDLPHERKEPRPDFSKPPPPEKLPPKLQSIVDNEDTLWDEVLDGKAGETTDSNLRYAAYFSRVRTILLAGHRYIAYSSDVGESFRPIAHPLLIRGAYAVSWAYLTGDVAHEGYKAYLRNQQVRDPVGYALKLAKDKGESEKPDTSKLKPGTVAAIDDYRSVMLQRGVFQGLASMGLPAFTIHSIVRYSGRAFKDVKNTRLRTYGPVGLGLAAVPFLPYMFDKPVEEAVDWIFYQSFKAFGGEAAVGHRQLHSHATKPSEPQEKVKEKEL